MTAIRGIGVSYGAISRSRGDGVLARSRYQRGFAWRADNLPENTEQNPAQRQWLLLPEGAPDWAMDPDVLWSCAANACKRRDAQEGRHFDVVWPRELPEAAAEEAVRLIYGRFQAMGLPVQINRHTVLASDGRPNPHFHGMIGTQVLDESGFSPRVCRDLANWFHAAGGKAARDHVANVLNELAALHDVDVHFDSRPNRERNLPLPEDRLPRSFIRRPDTAAAKEALTRRDAQRGLRRDHAALQAQTEQLEAQRRSLLDVRDDIRANALVVLPSEGNAGQRQLDARDWAELADLFAIGAPVDLGPDGVAIPVDGGAIVDTGDQLLVDGPMSSAKARVILEYARRKRWRGVKNQKTLESYVNEPARSSTSATARSADRSQIPGCARVGIQALIASLSAEGPNSTILSRLHAITSAENHTSTANILCQLRIFELGVAPPSVDDVISLVEAEHPAGDGGAAWLRWVTLQDFAAMMTRSNPLGAVVAGKSWRPVMKASVPGPAP